MGPVMTWWDIIGYLIQIAIWLTLTSFIACSLYAVFVFVRKAQEDRSFVKEEGDDDLLVFNYSKDDPWECSSCGRKFENRRDFNEPQQHYAYHHRNFWMDT